MNTLVRILTLVPILLVGCQATHDVASTSYHVARGAAVGSYKVARAVAVGSYHVASAPVHYVTGKRGDESTIVRTETPSDVFFFQAEDGIRDLTVTGVQTCALPI